MHLSRVKGQGSRVKKVAEQSKCKGVRSLSFGGVSLTAHTGHSHDDQFLISCTSVPRFCFFKKLRHGSAESLMQGVNILLGDFAFWLHLHCERGTNLT